MRKWRGSIAVALFLLASPVLGATPPPTVGVGFGALTVNGNMQIWAGAASHPDTAYTKTGGAGFRLRRFEVNLNGQIDANLQYHGMADFSRGSSTQSGIGVLQDMYLQYSLSPGQDLLFGQLKLPLTEVGVQSSAHLMTIERPLFVIAPAVAPKGASATAPALPGVPQWGDIRDIGIQYRFAQPEVFAQVALTSGAGDYQNSSDNRYGKQLTGEVLFHPSMVQGLQVGVTASAGAPYRFASGAAGFNLDRTRAGGSILYRRDKWIFETEYMGGTDGLLGGKLVTVVPPGTPTATFTQKKAIRHGEYGLVGYDLGGYSGGNGYQAVGMLDYWDPGAGASRQTNITLGINHDMDRAHRRLQLNYIHQHFQGPAAPAAADLDEVLLAAGVNW